MADWFMMLSIRSDFPHLTHLSCAEISFFAQWLVSFQSCLQWLVKVGCCWYCSVSCWTMKQTNKKNRRKDSWDPPLWRAEDASECVVIHWYLGYNVEGRKKKTYYEISAAGSTVQWSVQGAPFVPRLWQVALWQPQKLSLEKDSLVRRICCILTTASLWARNAVQQTAGEERLLAVWQVRNEVLRLFRGLEGELQCA